MNSENSCLKEVVGGTIATVLGGIILAAIPATRNFFGNLFDAAGKFFMGIWNFLISEITVPWLLIALLSLMALPTVIKLARAFVPKSVDNTEPKVEDYNEDMFFGVIWRWDSGNLVSYCPICQTRLVYHTEIGFPENKTTIFCETCNKGLNQFVGDRDSVLGKAWRQRERRINTGEWKQIAEKKERARN